VTGVQTCALPIYCHGDPGEVLFSHRLMRHAIDEDFEARGIYGRSRLCGRPHLCLSMRRCGCESDRDTRKDDSKLHDFPRLETVWDPKDVTTDARYSLVSGVAG
jgi:hypothetical protein